jgi:hypothetical protein
MVLTGCEEDAVEGGGRGGVIDGIWGREGLVFTLNEGLRLAF